MLDYTIIYCVVMLIETLVEVAVRNYIVWMY